MEPLEPRPEINRETPGIQIPEERKTNGESRVLGLARRWMTEHAREIAWALVFAVLAGYAFTFYIEDPKPYKIYVVADPDTDSDTLSKNFLSEVQKGYIAHIGRVPIQVQVELLDDQNKETAKKKAEDLIERPDTLLVIMHGRSEHVEHSLKTYLGVRPQVPVIATDATDDNLIAECDPSCVDQGWFETIRQGTEPFRPLLQLSPTNRVQGLSAIKFASQRYKRGRFLVVTSNNPADETYTKNMTEAYSDAIKDARAILIGIRKVDNLPSEADFKKLSPDCVLYAGGLGEAQALFDHISAMRLQGKDLIVMLSDSVIESRGTDSDLAEFGPLPVVSSGSAPHRRSIVVPAAVRERLQPALAPKIPVDFTYQSDAYDYNSHSNAYAEDAFSIALRLIKDLNERGGDIRFETKSFLHLYNVDDARRSLVSIMKQNSQFRTSYVNAASGNAYVFDGYRQHGGMFHVWRLKASSQSGSEMEDIDNWHPPRIAAQ